MMLKVVRKMTKFVRDEKGTSIIEFAFIAILVFGLLFAIVDLGMMFYVNLTMQNAVREGARYSITGLSDLDPAGQRASVIQKIKNSSVGLCDKNPCNTTFLYRKDDGSFGPLPTNPGDPQSLLVGVGGNIIEIKVAYSWPLLTPLMKPFFPNGKYNFTVGATMKNEPFPVSGG